MTLELATHTFVLQINDKPGAMELIAAAFAQRGVSLSTTLGADSALSETGRGKILLTFSATHAKKEVLRRALLRLSRVHSLEEYPSDSPLLRKTALLRLAPEAPAPALPNGCGTVERVAQGEESGEATYLVAGMALEVDKLLEELRAKELLRDVTQTTLAL
ncbi:MAG TPA: hypothetical protein VF627_04095 [Abditibacterium sp.]|jgi:acetolactate synthase small subunit